LERGKNKLYLCSRKTREAKGPGRREKAKKPKNKFGK
jgi:hypothetical protein